MRDFASRRQGGGKMLFNTDLETIVFERHNIFDTDELVVLSGYVSPSPIQQVCSLPIRSTIIYGMYGTDRIRRTLHNSLVALQNANERIRIFYSRIPVHSKCYIWKYHGEIIHALVGSANFTTNGLRTPFKEILAETTKDTFEPLNNYINTILGNSLLCVSGEVILREAPPRPQPEVPAETQLFCRMTLLDPATNDTPSTSGLNWGQGERAHTTRDDAYIAIRREYLRTHPELFPEKLTFPSAFNGRGRPQRHNDAIDILWDDGVNMQGLMEGNQELEGRTFPKQISSFPQKRILGEYFRRRLNVPSGARVTRQHLEAYGRTHIDLSLVSEGVYNCDFSV
jgi:hypothetical protein